MSKGRRCDRRLGNTWDEGQSEDPNIVIYGEKARPLPQDGKLPTNRDVDLAVEFHLENTEADYHDQHKLAVKAILWLFQAKLRHFLTSFSVFFISNKTAIV